MSNQQLLDEIPLNDEQANLTAFPPGCEVYILYDENESPPSIDAQGYVVGVSLRRMTNNAFVEYYTVEVKCRNDEGVFYPKKDVVEVSKLRFKNGCHVNFNVRDDSTASNNNETIQKGGIILGFCDIPEEKMEDKMAVKNRFWYCVQEIQGEKKIFYQVLPEKITYRHREADKKNDEDHGDVVFVKAEIKEAEVFPNKPINIPAPSAIKPNIIRDTSPDSSKDKTNGLLHDGSSLSTQGISRDPSKSSYSPSTGSSRSFDDKKENRKCMKLPMVLQSFRSPARSKSESRKDLISSRQSYDQSKNTESKRVRKRNLDDCESTNSDGRYKGRQAKERRDNTDSENFTCCLEIPFRKQTVYGKDLHVYECMFLSFMIPIIFMLF